jgi:ribosomal protein S18 acetylase RimI-like enzyme
MATVTYCKRLVMEVDLEWIDPVPSLPHGFTWVPWHESTLPTHADVKWRSFRKETDSRLFQNLANLDGCVQLMQAIRDLPGFLADATWLILAPDECCGTVQGVCNLNGMGMIQNLGVVPEYRGIGLGKTLLLQSLHGFKRTGVKQVTLEVTARNLPAIRIYHGVGFVERKTLYRELHDSDNEWYDI